ncbi:hypothetical protein [Kitasatospora viridis]|uniref:Uncharacterized protein n=1 Tax=Kitasatospora viridis TaxID=281105 RepID=A0A561T744_9ACTN|nr:hypothetical protein [Kitasatospora viridis]TWF82928.1 hypothetical protein FHX73_14411 [Kitasatospora viridis]
MGGESADAAERFTAAVERLRRELRAVADTVAPGGRWRAEERTRDEFTERGAMTRRFTLSLVLADASFERTPFELASFQRTSVQLASVQLASVQRTSFQLASPEAVRDGFTVSARAVGGTVRITGSTPAVLVRDRWVRPPRAVDPGSLRPGYRLCDSCEGWGSCRDCEGLGFVGGRPCRACGLGMDCPDCAGAGQSLD